MSTATVPDDFEASVGALAGGVPVALLPVRLEARFFTDPPELRVRIFPDQIHVDAHEPALTRSERDAGMAYWTERFRAPDPAVRTTSPWTTLCTVVGPARATWVAHALTPTNVAALGQPVTPAFPATPARPSTWSLAARAVALPARWVVIGMRDGRQLFRKWTNVVSDTLEVTPAPDTDIGPVAEDALGLQPAARWLVDFGEAERAGMAARITAAEIGGPASLAAGVDRLFVLGVDWTLKPNEAADSIRRLLTSHMYTDGLSAIKPGTPTNVTAASRPGAPPSDATLAVALDPEHHPSAAAIRGAAADRLWRALGIATAPDDPLTAIPGAGDREQDVAARMANALWESTLGSYLTDFLSPLFPDARCALVRDHVVGHLLPGGPFPAIRIARQPYGVLPVVARSRFSPAGAGIETELVGLLEKLRPFWEDAVNRDPSPNVEEGPHDPPGTDRHALANRAPPVPHLGRMADLDADLTALLQTTPLASTFRLRSVLGPLAVNATTGLEGQAESQATITAIVCGGQLGSPVIPDRMVFTAHPAHQRLRVPLVDTGPVVAGARLSKDYLRAIADLTRTSGTHDAMKDREKTVTTLLEALAVHAVERELHRADMRTINAYRVASGQIGALPDVGVMPLSEYVGIEAVTRPPPAEGVLVTTPSEVSRVVIPTVTGQQTVRQFVTAAVKRGARVPPEYATLSGVLGSLEYLGTRPAEELDRALRGLLDAYGHRLDAWYTSLATRRLAAVRKATPEGVHLGSYGWLDDLRPAAAGAAVSRGFIHTPSLAQAATAAVLRSGHLAHNDAEHKALDLDLSSVRVRTALGLLDGVTQGQPLTALLGYRFERAVRARGVQFAQYILPFRRLLPLRPAGGAAAAPSPSDNVAARDVVDGVALLDRWRTDRARLFDALQAFITWPPPPAEVFVMPPQSIRDELAVELDRLSDAYDAVADVLVAEAVHQNVLGNNERAGAALAALDRQGRPPPIDFVRTPRTGKSFTQRLLVLVPDESLPPPWQTVAPDARAKAEPRLNAWIARLIGDPRHIRVAATASGATRELTTTIDQLGLSPLSLVMAAHAPGQDARSELEERLLQRIAAQLTAPAAGTKLVLLDTAPAGSNAGIIGLGALRALLRRIYALITTHRPATARDLALPQDEADEGLDGAQLGARADALAAAFASTLTTLRAAVAAASSTDQALRDGLWAAAAFGVDGSVPAPAPPGGNDPSGHGDLIAQAHAVADTMRDAAATERKLAAVRPGATPQQRVKHHTQRIRTLLGEQFPVLPCFKVANAAALAASHAQRTTLCAGDDLAPATWLQRMALVRPGVDRLTRVRGAAELLGSNVVPRDLLVVQLPQTKGERWLALPFVDAPADAELAIVAHYPSTMNFSAPLAGLFCDAWPETIPGREETTGIAFHHDAPGARAPQAVLLAVPPAVTNQAWSVDTILDTVVEAHDLARIRGVGPDTLEWLGTLLPAILLPDPASPEVPAVNLKDVAATEGLDAAVAAALGKE
jgi:hypothetical protein